MADGRQLAGPEARRPSQDDGLQRCVICQGQPQRPMRAHPCGHSLCSLCMCQYLTAPRRGAAGPARPRCPVCRAEVRRAEVSRPEPGSWCLHVRHRHVTFLLDFSTINSTGTGVEHAEYRLGELFGISQSRLKLIHRGKLISTDSDLMVLSRAGKVLTLVGSLEGPAPSLLRFLTWAYIQRAAEDVLERLLHVLQPVLRMGRAFLASLSPSYSPSDAEGRSV